MIDTGIFWFKTRLTGRNKFIFNKKLEHFIKHLSFKNVPIYRQQRHWTVVLKHLFAPFLRILILLWPWALFRSMFSINFTISLWEKLEKDRRLPVKYLICYWSLPLLFIKEQCVAKWQFKNSTFSLKYVTNLFSWSKGGIRRILFLFKRHLSRDQYALQFLVRLVRFFVIRA